ncbi:MAG: SDR family NAD(P)-dependent oxidoreductase [Chloroflexota bacterium]
MTEQYILLTGGHTGLGLGVTQKLLKPGNKVGLIIRSEARKQQTLSAFDGFSKELVDEIDFFYADLTDQAQVRAVAQEIAEKWPRIDRLFNNAAIFDPRNERRTSKHGNEMHLEINVFAPLLLTRGLQSLLENSADPKVITTVTTGMGRRKLRTDQILDKNYKRGSTLYMQSKQAVLHLMNELADEMPTVKFLAVDPGPNKTKMTKQDSLPGLMKLVVRLFFNEPEVGTQRIYDAGFDAQFAAENRVYITSDKIVPIKHGMTEQEKQALLAGIRSN